MVFVCIMLLGLTRRDINLFFSFSDFETRTRINPDIFQTKRLLRKILSFFVSKICRVFFAHLNSCEYDVPSIPWSALYNMCDSSEENTCLLEDVADFGHVTHVLSASTTSSLPLWSHLPSSSPSMPSALPTALSSLEMSRLLSVWTHSRRWATRSAPDHYYWRAVSQSPKLFNNIVFTLIPGFVFYITYL